MAAYLCIVLVSCYQPNWLLCPTIWLHISSGKAVYYSQCGWASRTKWGVPSSRSNQLCLTFQPPERLHRLCNQNFTMTLGSLSSWPAYHNGFKLAISLHFMNKINLSSHTLSYLKKTHWKNLNVFNNFFLQKNLSMSS